MTWLRKLLLFGGVPAAGASASVPIVLRYQGNRNAVEGFNENEKVGEIDISGIEVNTKDKDEQIKILKRAGLFCGTTIEDGKECKVYSVGLRLKDGNNVEGGLKISSSSTGKLVLRKSNPYSYGLRLTVEGGEISLEGSGKAPKKLERFESFGLEEQVKEGGEKELHLVKKETHQQGVMRALGIPSNCELPQDGNTRTCYLSHEHIKSVHFDGKKKEGATISNTSQNITLSISKSVDPNLFKESYRFAFSSPSEITIKEGDVIRTNASTEFTVKEWNEENMVLVRAGSGEKEEEFFSKVGLKCTGNVGNETCTIQGGKLNVIKGDSTDNNKLTAGSRTGTGKGIIKLYREQANYVNGLKFSIEGEDITIAGKPAGSHINRLSLLDGYEIVESKGHFYLKRKQEWLAEIVKRLGLFDNPSNVENSSEPIFKTSIPSNQINKIKFYEEDKEVSISGSAAIDVHGYRTTDTDTYKYGYRFSLKPNGDVNIGKKTKIKKNVSIDFKIREEGEKLYLERAVDPEKLIEMVGLKCTKEEDNQTETCTFQEGKANVRHWNGNIKGANASTQKEVGKLKLTRDQADYTDGFMFEVIGGDITFTGGTQDKEKIKMSEFEKYGITKENGTWFLNQKTNFMQEKYGALGIEEKCNNQFHGECEMGGMHVANNVNFKVRKGKQTKGQFSTNAKVKFQMSKNVMYPFGIKVDMRVEEGGNDRYVSVVCKDNDTQTLLKLTKDKTEFKIEKDGTSFYLTKAQGGETDVTCNAPAAK